MAQTQKIYLGTHPVEKRYLGEHPIVVNGSFNDPNNGLVLDGLTYYFNSKETANATNWPAGIGNKTGSYATPTTVYYNSTDKVVEIDGSGTPSLQFSGGWDYDGNPPTEHSLLIFTKPKRVSGGQMMSFNGDFNFPNERVELRLSGTTFVYENNPNYTYSATEFGSITANDWHLFGYGFSGSIQTDVDLYYDDDSTTVSGDTSTVDIGSAALEMGTLSGGEPYSGSMGAVLIYDRKITSSESAQLYRYLTSQFT